MLFRMSDTSSRRALRADDFADLATALRASPQPQAICAALDRISGATIGHRLFTVMRFDAERMEVERLYSNQPASYPVGGRKQKKETAWGDHVLRDRKVFRGNDADAIRWAFDDHAKILGLGLSSVLNVPVVLDGRCVGTMNLLHDAGWYSEEDERTGLTLAAFLAPVLAKK